MFFDKSKYLKPKQKKATIWIWHGIVLMMEQETDTQCSNQYDKQVKQYIIVNYIFNIFRYFEKVNVEYIE